MSLTVALENPASAVNAFFDEYLPYHESLVVPWARILSYRGGGVSVGAPHLIGAAIEMLIGFDLAESLPYGDVAAAVCSTVGHEPLKALGYEPPAGTDSDDVSIWRKADRDAMSAPHSHAMSARFCYQLAYAETIAYAVSKTELDPSEGLVAFWKYTELEPPDGAVDTLVNLWRTYAGSARMTVTALGEPTAVRPSFAEGFAAGDLAVGPALVEVKCERRPAESLARTLRQVVGCALANSDDSVTVESVGVYHANQGYFAHWPLEHVLRRLSSSGEPNIRELRARFAEAIATERALIRARRQYSP